MANVQTITFPVVADLNTYYAMIRERDLRFNPGLSYKRLDPIQPAIDSIHNEVDEEDKVFLTPVTLVAFAQEAMEDLPMTQFGIEVIRDLIMVASVPSLDAVGLLTQSEADGSFTLLAGIGDRFTFSDFEYNVIHVRRFHHYANSDIPIDFEFSATKHRVDSDIYAGL